MEVINGQIAVLILFYNKLKQTAECVLSFLPSGENIYILNNGSSLDAFADLKMQFSDMHQVHFLDAGTNLGPAGGRNYLISHTTEPWMFFVDNDITIVPEQSWKECLESFRIEYPDAEIICPRIFNVHENAYMDGMNLEIENGVLHLNLTVERIMNVFPEGGAIVHRNIFERYGLYDAEMSAFEGYEFSIRCNQTGDGGLKAYRNESITLLHDHRYQETNTDKNTVRARYNTVQIQKSYNRLVERHKITFHHEWKWWTNKQLEEMTSPKLWLRMKRRLKRFLNL